MGVILRTWKQKGGRRREWLPKRKWPKIVVTSVQIKVFTKLPFYH